MSVYHDVFNDWGSVAHEFEIDRAEPDEVLFAAYECENYSGDALVIFREGGETKAVFGSHCSCYGLEDQWKPEPITAEMIRRMLREDEIYNDHREWLDGTLMYRHREALRAVADRIDA